MGTILKHGFTQWCFLLLCAYFSIYHGNFAIAQSPTYTEMEKAALIKFRELVKNDIYRNYMNSDIYLIRWLRAKDFDQIEAHRMLKNAMKWRKENKVDGIIEEVVYEPKSKPFYMDGTDNRGSVVGTILASRFDTRSFIVQGRRDIPIRFFIQVMEAGEQEIYKRSGIIGNGTITGPDAHLADLLLDESGYNLRQHGCLSCLGVYFEWFRIYENYYPGYGKHFIFINAPRIFAPLVEFMKPLMSKMTRKAFKVYGPNKAEWKAAIVGKIIPASELRPQFGGTKTGD